MSLRRPLIIVTSLVLLGAFTGWALQRWLSNSRAKASPIVILIGLDGFRPDYLETLKPPVITRLAREGTTTPSMRPSFPTLTFPNLYTLVTGQYPARHGIIGNNMYDPEFKATFALGSPSVVEGRWWNGEPVWNTAQRQGLKASCMFWPGSEAEINGMRPTDWRPYDGRFTPAQRVGTVLEWLKRPEKDRPRMITLYFHEADSAGHRYGPDSNEVAQAVADVDKAIGHLLHEIKTLNLNQPINLVLCSDHGMAALSPDRIISLPTLVDMNRFDVDFSGAFTGLRPKENASPQEAAESIQELVAKLKTLEAENHFKVYLRDETPYDWRFKQNRRIPPVLILADEGWFISRKPLLTAEARQSFLKGTHGFSPDLPSMQSVFIAWGPAFKEKHTIPPFDNVEVYPLLCAVLGISPAPNDAHSVLLPQVLKAGELSAYSK